jgi:membrane protein
MAFAGTLAYRALFALFPFLIFVISVLGAAHQLDVLKDGLRSLQDTLPKEMYALIKEQIVRLTSTAGGTFTFGAIFAAIIALWGISGAFRAVMESLNVMHEVDEGRGKVRVYVTSLVLALVCAALFVISLTLVVAGPAIAEWVADTTHTGAVMEWAWKIGQWPVLVLLVLFAFSLIYHQAPDSKKPWRLVSRGALFAVGLWIVFTLVFSLYVNNFSSYNETYGTIAGVAVLMLYLYYSSLILLLGAKVDLLLES